MQDGQRSFAEDAALCTSDIRKIRKIRRFLYRIIIIKTRKNSGRFVRCSYLFVPIIPCADSAEFHQVCASYPRARR